MGANKQLPKIFGIGLPHSGGHILPSLFSGSGNSWLHHRSGKLGQSLAFAHATGQTPFQEWPNATGFSGLHSIHKRHLPALVLRDHLAFLRDAFPDAYFIHTYRDPADWVASQFWADDGAHRTLCAWHANIDEAALPAHWLEEHESYAALCAQVFADHPRYMDINLTSEVVDKIQNFLNSTYDLPHLISVPDMTVAPADIDAVVTHVMQSPPADDPRPADMLIARQVAEFCAQTKAGHSKPKVLGSEAVVWTKNRTVTNRTGDTVAIIQHNNTGPYLLKPDSSRLQRAQATLNDLIAHGAKPPLHIDMMDARFLGSDGHRLPPHRTVAFNRRKGAKNITLWPLGGYHNLAPTGTPNGFARDVIPFEDKTDRCIWLGNLTGRMSVVLTPEGRDRRGVYKIRDQAVALPADSPDWADLITDLDCVPRYRVVKTYRDHPDFEVGFVMRSHWKKLEMSPAFAGLCDPMRPQTFFHDFRYILSLAGNDTGSNFIVAASTNALILKEEDGWEQFYTDAFKPWVHYVPLEEAAVDVEEKLKWARANPQACAAMVKAATQVFDALANPTTRTAYLTAIAEGLNEGL